MNEGDYNIDLPSFLDGHKACNFINVLICNNTFPFVSLPTLITQSSSTLIDSFITNDSRLQYRSKHIHWLYLGPLPYCNYRMLKYHIKLTVHSNSTHYSSTTSKYLALTESNKTNFKNALASTNWHIDTTSNTCRDNFRKSFNNFPDNATLIWCSTHWRKWLTMVHWGIIQCHQSP